LHAGLLQWILEDEQPETGAGKWYGAVHAGNFGLNWLVLGSFKVNLKVTKQGKTVQ
jgi:hypothetical protein